MATFIFDTETTDLISNSMLPLEKQPHVIEFYGALYDDGGNKLSEYETFIDPGIAIQAITTKITGIKQADLLGAPKFPDVALKIKGAMGESDTIVAHNLSFDMQMLEFEFKRCGVAINWPRWRICTVEGTEHIKGYRLNLSALHHHCFGEGFSGAHRAKADVEALARCYFKLVEEGEI